MPDVPPGWLHAGTVGRPHGLDGSFHVVAANPTLLSLDGAVRISTSGEERRITRRAGTDAGRSSGLRATRIGPRRRR